MALNPIAYTENVVRSFLRYQLTAYSFADERLHAQMRQLLSLDETRQSPLLKGPYVSLSRSFQQGASVESLVQEKLIHPHLLERIPSGITHLYRHQEKAIRSISEGKTTLVSTGTGSGKTECFLYPAISQCLKLRDENAPPGISTVIVYPMNALAEDQLMRLRNLLAGTEIPFGIYVGKTPEREADVAGVKLNDGASRADYESRLKQAQRESSGETVYPAEEICSREVMRAEGKQPRILLTNVKQLELLLTRQKDAQLFTNARLDFLIFDEAHTFTGALGAETACLIRRLRAFCDIDINHTTCVATSATIVDREDPDAARKFAARFFGVTHDSVTTVSEDYEEDVWEETRFIPPTPDGNVADILSNCIDAVEDENNSNDEQVTTIHRALAGKDLPGSNWPEALHTAMSCNELVFHLKEELHTPRALMELPSALEHHVGRSVTEEEILAWLTLGAAARKQGRPLLRPIAHNFVRGISGAVVTFPESENSPKLWLAAEDEISREESQDQHAHFPVTTCTTCGQHYYIAFLKDFFFTKSAPEGGESGSNGSWWYSKEETSGGKRVVLVDKLISQNDEDEDTSPPARTVPLHFCRRCGSAHLEAQSRCLSCGDGSGTVQLHAIQQKEKNPGQLISCLSCRSTSRRVGGFYREPARPVRAINVADVHVLTQDMVHHAQRRRLLVFCDNRQDAAFQAGWMKDHARRFRLRALMMEGIKDRVRSIGDLSGYLDELMEKDETLSRALLPEVWRVARREDGGTRHQQERRKFLRFQTLREVTMSSRQARGLEPWGRMKIEYAGLDSSLPWIQESAHLLNLPPDSLQEGVASVLDYLRRRGALYDPEHEIFTKYWQKGDPEIQQGYLLDSIRPNSTKLRRRPSERSEVIMQWLSGTGDTPMRQIAKKWGAKREMVQPFLESLFDFLVKNKLLIPVRLKGARGRPLSRVQGVHQVNGDKLIITPNKGMRRCRSCRRTTTRDLPHNRCPAWRCQGALEWVSEDPDNYDLQLLDSAYEMLRPEEHTAMVPNEDRERLENLFKGESEAVNCLVCTPTLELGIDIGQLDSVLMRNVPPLPANYWQRAGRAGRRHRMAVDITYCRPVSHDRAYFSEPPKLLAGRIDPPAFNLRNEVMISKHVHATIITSLHRYCRDNTRPENERAVIRKALSDCLPSHISPYLFEDDGKVRTTPFDFTALRQLVQKNSQALFADTQRVFEQGWPESDTSVITPEALRTYVEKFTDNLENVTARLRRRLRWAMSQIQRLNDYRQHRGTLTREDEDLFRRCDNLVRRLKGTYRRRRSQAEGYYDSNTFNVLAAEGFLPGYGLETGSIIGDAEVPFWLPGAKRFTLPRPPATALREYVPGNLIYANGHRFIARRFHREIGEEYVEMPYYEVSLEHQAVKPVGANGHSTLGGSTLQTIAVCDTDLIHSSHISDEEEFRFQLGVAVYGLELNQHSGGVEYHWGAQATQLRHGVHIRLVNVGAAPAIRSKGKIGYPVCRVCGQSISPLSSDIQHQKFAEGHKERCGREPKSVGFYADIVADVFSLPACDTATTAYSTLEALRFAAARVLDMHTEDLQILVIGHLERDSVDALLWDPMPGGSGLLDRICECFEEIVRTARNIVDDCPTVCDSSCIDCLQTFRNVYYHEHLDRRLAKERLEEWGEQLMYSHDIPPLQQNVTSSEQAMPANEAETKLRHLLLAAGFGEGIRGEQIRLNHAIGTTTPDVIYRTESHEEDEGVCIYLDGLSTYLHGNPETANKDREIRDWLRNSGYEVIEIAVSELDDEKAMTRHFRRLARYLQMPNTLNQLRDSPSWSRQFKEALSKITTSRLQLVTPTSETRYVTCVPLIPLQIAAGTFGNPNPALDESEWQWVKPNSTHTPRPGTFVAAVTGKSMEPKIPDGSYCLFASPVAGTRQGKIVLTQLHDATDPETGNRFTVKRYRSTKTENEDGWRHTKITLEPINSDYNSIELTTDDENSVAVIAELIDVLGQDAPVD